jgi:hypothetical protein
MQGDEGIRYAPKGIVGIQQANQEKPKLHSVSFQEISKADFLKDPYGQLRQVLGSDMVPGNDDALEDARFGFATLPKDKYKRTQAVNEIMKQGCWNTSTSPGQAQLDLYIHAAAEIAQIDPREVFSCVSAEDVRAIISEGITTIRESNLRRSVVDRPNTILVYNARDLRQIVGQEYTFKNPDQRARALCAVIVLK